MFKMYNMYIIVNSNIDTNNKLIMQYIKLCKN